MKKVLFFYVKGCPYCAQARKARQELIEEKPEYARVEFNEVDEGAEPDLADQYDYWATPAMFIDGEKIYESHLGEKYEEARESVKRVLDRAMED